MTTDQQLDAFLTALAERVAHRPRDARDAMLNFGTDNSGVPVVILPGAGPGPGKSEQVLSIDCKTRRGSSARRGVCTVTVDVKDASARVIATSNQKLDLTVRYQSGRAIGVVKIDAQRGTTFSCSAEDAIQIDGQIVAGEISAVTGAPLALVPGQDLAVTAAVSWGQVSYPPPLFSSPRIALVGGAPSINMPIPSGARELWVFTDTAANVVTVAFTASTAAVYQADQGRNSTTTALLTLVAGGVDGFTLTGTKNSIAQPVWVLTQLA